MRTLQVLLLVLLGFTVANATFLNCCLFDWSCGFGRVCRNFKCESSCCDQNCNGGNTCSNGGCVSKCSLVNCPHNTRCENGNCIPTS